MTELGRAEEREVILAFLRGEIDSPRFGPTYVGLLTHNGLERSALIDNADLKDLRQNAIRRELLRCVRGYDDNSYLFAGFPNDVVWRRVLLEPSEHVVLKYANYPTWVDLSGGTRLVMDGAKNVERMGVNDEPRIHIEAIQRALQGGRKFAPLIAVEAQDGFLILVEGHSRATAYAASRLAGNIDLLVGSSPAVPFWHWY
jgi:hypothetical protein